METITKTQEMNSSLLQKDYLVKRFEYFVGFQASKATFQSKDTGNEFALAAKRLLGEKI